MKIEKEIKNSKLYLSINGRLDTVTAPELEHEIDNLNNINEIIFDMKNLEYISSAGLRIILKVQKLMNKKGLFKLINVNKDIMEIFDITGFSDFLTIE